jgi:hypothetical protein
VWIGNRLPKESRMAGVGMPQFSGGKIATGELAQVTGDTRWRSFYKVGL